MFLDEYEWSRNPRGMHSALNYLNISEMIRNRMGLAKIVALADGEIALAESLLNAGITPIVRIYRERPGNAPPDALAYQQYQAYRSAGVRWFEYYNEPNIDVEWPHGTHYDPNNSAILNPLMDNWLAWAEFIVNMGGYPGFPALTDVNNGSINDTITWIRRMLQYLFDTHYDRFRNVLNNGGYVATHPYYFNHFYQEISGGGPTSARPASAQSADEGGWHFEYPYDPINQRADPGRTVFGGTSQAPYGDTVGLLGSATAIMSLLQEMFDVGAIPFIGTEGGSFAPSTPDSILQADTRYPAYTWNSHAESTVAMFDWISTTAPPWFFGLTLWKHDEYYDTPYGSLPVTERLAQRAPLYKTVPHLPALNSTPETVVEVVGPYIPDYHFVFLAPDFDESWFFDHAQGYWDQFRPILLSEIEFLDRFDSALAIAVTAITVPAMVDWLAANIVQRWPHIRLDTIVVERSEDLAALLNQRVVLGRRLG